jgi:hypothetical protein
MDSESFEKRLAELCPNVAMPRQGATIVRLMGIDLKVGARRNLAWEIGRQIVDDGRLANPGDSGP